MDQQLTGPKEESEEEDKTAAQEDKVTFLDALKGLEMERQYMFQFDMEDKLENELHRQIAKGKKKATLNDVLNK